MEITVKKVRRNFSQSQKIGILQELETKRVSLSDLARQHGISPVTIYSWKRTLRETMKKPEVVDLAEILKENERLKLENSVLKETVSDLAVDKRILECSNEIYRRDQLKKKLNMPKKSSKRSKKKK